MLKFKPLTNPLGICTDIDQLVPYAQEKFTAFEAKCKAAGINLRRTESFRDPRRSAELHKKNPSGAADAGHSMHNYRVACDYCINSRTKPYDTDLLAKAGKIWESMGFHYVWGGDWNHNGKVGDDHSIDMPHFQVISIAEENTIRSFGTDWDKTNNYLKTRK